MSWFTQNRGDYTDYTGTFIPMTEPPPTYSGNYYTPTGALVLTEDIETPPAYEEHVRTLGGYDYDYEAGVVEFGEEGNLCGNWCGNWWCGNSCFKYCGPLWACFCFCLVMALIIYVVVSEVIESE